VTDDRALIASYAAVADDYVEHVHGELAGKPLDRALLDAFVDRTRGRGRIYDLGCGPGHVAQYVHDRGAIVTGVDLAPAMIDRARALHPAIDFAVGDLRALAIPDGGAAGALLFYSIVHLAPDALAPVCTELRRVLAPGAPALIAFHIGTDVVHLADWWGKAVDVDFYFHDPAVVTAALRRAGLGVVEHTERDPYPDVEYQSRRAYIAAV
jgi:SAM-dependent methyltransferase